MKLLIFAIVISFCLTIWACLVAAARADEASETMYEKWQKKKFEKN